MHFVKQCGTKSISKVGIIKVCDMAPKTIIAVAIFGNQTVNVRIPLKIHAKSMKNHDVAGSEVFGFIHFNREDYDCTGAEYVFWYYETGDRVKKLNGYMEKGGYLIRKRESLNQERREKR